MGSRMLHAAPLTQAPELVTLRFRLQYVTDAVPDFQRPAGSVASNTRTSEGLYTMTLNEKYPVLIGAVAHVMPASANYATLGGLRCTVDVADYVASTGVLTYRTGWGDGAGTGAMTLADVADNDWVYFELTFSRKHDLSPVGAA